jgi:hypothetical protein
MRLCIVCYPELPTDIGICGVIEAWRKREKEILRIANEKFRKLEGEEQMIMVTAIKDAGKGLAGN